VRSSSDDDADDPDDAGSVQKHGGSDDDSGSVYSTDDDDDTGLVVEESAQGGPATAKAGGRTRLVHFMVDPEHIQEFDTYTKEEYDRVLDAGNGCTNLRQLFAINSEEKEAEQEREVIDSLEPLQWHGVRIDRTPDHEGFGLVLTAIPRLSPASPNYLYAEAVVITVLMCCLFICLFVCLFVCC
jgi:hypothetical protein